MTLFTAAITSFRMISILPDNIPRIVGFYGQGRAGMDEFASGSVISPSYQTGNILQQNAGQQMERFIAESGGSYNNSNMLPYSPINTPGRNNMDSTTHNISESPSTHASSDENKAQ